MLKQVTVTLDTSDPLQAQLLVEYFASEDRASFGRCCLLLGYLLASGQVQAVDAPPQSGPATESGASPAGSVPLVRQGVLGAGLFGLK